MQRAPLQMPASTSGMTRETGREVAARDLKVHVDAPGVESVTGSACFADVRWQVEAVVVHHPGPGPDEVGDELLLGVVGGVHL